MAVRASRATIVCFIGIAATTAWLLVSLLQPAHIAHLSSGEVCFVHVGSTERPLPTVCVTGEARAPHGADTIVVVLSRSNLTRFLQALDAQAQASRSARAEFGSYEIRDSIRRTTGERVLAREQMMELITQLRTVAQADEQSGGQQQALKQLLERLGRPA